MLEGEFILLGTARDADGVPWALLASDPGGELEFAGPAILNPAQGAQSGMEPTDRKIGGCRAAFARVRQGSAQWLRPELRVRVKHLKAKGVLRHASVKQIIWD